MLFQVVNYKEMKVAEEFEDYLKMSKELQRVSVEKLDQDELKAFFINIYNALVIHATIVNGPPTNWFTRSKVKLCVTVFLFLPCSPFFSCILLPFDLCEYSDT